MYTTMDFPQPYKALMLQGKDLVSENPCCEEYLYHTATLNRENITISSPSITLDERACR